MEELTILREKIEKELANVASFWMSNSHDEKHGGFFNCIYEDGRVYDDLKYVWLQGRQVWMYCRLYNEMNRFQKKKILDAAEKAAKFLMDNVKREDNRCYFCVTSDGEPVKLQRTIFSECFYVMAMTEVGRATGNKLYKDEACHVFESIMKWVQERSLPDGHIKMNGSQNSSNLSVYMMIYCIVYEICYCFPDLCAEYGHYKSWAVSRIMKHVQRDGKVVLETVTDDGEELPGAAGRLFNPGHVLEAGWFLLQHAVETNDDELKSKAIELFIKQPFEIGWDKKNGGLYYFLDIDGYSPVQLEWNFKLWWPHCEAMIAFIMAYKVTRDEELLGKFKTILDYTLDVFSDPLNGEWYGYLSEKGSVTHNFKGGPFKGCFHIPRALFMCQKIIKEIQDEHQVNGD
eukprot:gene7358-8178_t